MELLASGRTADVFVSGAGRVVKVDRPGWEGLAEYELGVLERLHRAGLPVPQPHGAVRVGGRTGVEMEHLRGPTLEAVVEQAPCGDLSGLALGLLSLQRDLHVVVLDGLPALVPRLRDEVARSGLGPEVVAELDAFLAVHADDPAGLCHGDLHPGNIIVTASGWRVVDWVNASNGPAGADVARTFVLLDERPSPRLAGFREQLDRACTGADGSEPSLRRSWVRAVGAARRVELP